MICQGWNSYCTEWKVGELFEIDFGTPIYRYTGASYNEIAFDRQSVYDYIPPDKLYLFCVLKHQLIWDSYILWFVLVGMSICGLFIRRGKTSIFLFIMMIVTIVLAIVARHKNYYDNLSLSMIVSCEYTIIVMFAILLNRWINESTDTYKIIKVKILIQQLMVTGLGLYVYGNLNSLHNPKTRYIVYPILHFLLIVIACLEFWMFFKINRRIGQYHKIILIHIVVQSISTSIMMLANVSFTVIMGTFCAYIYSYIPFLKRYMSVSCIQQIYKLKNVELVLIDLLGLSFIIPMIVSVAVRIEEFMLLNLLFIIWAICKYLIECYDYHKHLHNHMCQCNQREIKYQIDRRNEKIILLKLSLNIEINSVLTNLPLDLNNIIIEYSTVEELITV